MTITEARDKCKNLVAKVPRDALILGIIVVASSFSFGLGYLAGLDASRFGNELLDVPLTTTETEGKFVASKSGTKYYLPSCAGAERISDANKVWFVSESLAESAGYTLAANCKGI
ncbi:hypothetical protein HY412_01855 [Candidatus Kaiserbacteria bacterium]|nr:hypothetical protein [Candidatus Kaiserbacteria bacterium]